MSTMSASDYFSIQSTSFMSTVMAILKVDGRTSAPAASFTDDSIAQSFAGD